MDGEAFVRRAEEAPRLERAHEPGYEFLKRIVVGKGDSKGLEVSVYEVPPGKSAVPYHYHLQNEEVFFILSGTGVLKSPDGERTVTAGDFLYFPAGGNGAHKLTNASGSEKLIYLDVDTLHDPEVAFYPDSEKVGVFGSQARLILPVSAQVDYYEGE